MPWNGANVKFSMMTVVMINVASFGVQRSLAIGDRTAAGGGFVIISSSIVMVQIGQIGTGFAFITLTHNTLSLILYHLRVLRSQAVILQTSIKVPEHFMTR